MRDVVDAASSVASSAAAAPAPAPANRDTAPLNPRRVHRGASLSFAAGANAGSNSHHSSLRGLSGCYECRAINMEPMSKSV